MGAHETGVSRSLMRSGMIVSLLLFFAKLTGLARDAGLAAVFGTGVDLQAYAVGVLGSGFVTGALLVTSLSGTLVPAYTGRRDSIGEKAAFAHWLSLGGPLLLGFVGLAVIAYILAPQTTALLGPGLEPEAYKLAVDLSRGFALSIPLSFIAGWFGALLHANRRFVEVGLRTACINIALIVAMFGWASELGAWSLWAGTVLGNLIEIGIQLPFVIRKWKECRGEKSESRLSEFVNTYLPLVSVSVCLNMLTLLDRSYGTMVMSVGAAMMMYADRLVEISRALVGRTIAMVLLPELGGVAGPNAAGAARESAEDKAEERSGEIMIQRSLSVVTVLTIPMALALMFYGPSLSYWIFLGKLPKEDVLILGDALVGLSPAAVFFSIVWVLDRVFASRGWSRVFLFTVVTGVAVNWGLKALTVGSALFWVGMGSSAGLFVTVLFSVIFMTRKLGRGVLRPYFVDAVGALVCFCGPMIGASVLLDMHHGDEWRPFVALCACVLSSLVGLALHWVADFPFWTVAPSRFRSPLRKRLSVHSLMQG